MTVRGLLGFAAPHRWSLAALTALTLLGSGVLLALPWLGGRMIGGMLLRQAPTERLLALLLAALAALALINAGTLFLASATSARILADLRARIYDHLQALPLSFHHQRRQGDILALATFEVARLGRFVTSTMVSFPSRMLTALGAIVLMFRIDPRLALLVPTLVPIFYVILKVVGRRLRHVAVASQQAEADVVATIDRNLSMLAAIKSFAREDREAAAYRFHVERSMRLSIREGRIHALLEPLVGLVAASAAVVLLYVSGRNVSAGTMSAAQLFSFLFYAALLTRPVAAAAADRCRPLRAPARRARAAPVARTGRTDAAALWHGHDPPRRNAGPARAPRPARRGAAPVRRARAAVLAG